MLMPDLIGNGVIWFFSWLFAMAAIHKFRAPEDYLPPLRAYFSVFPVGQWAVLLVAVMEASLALMLLLPQTRLYGLLGSAIVLSVYAGFMAVQIFNGHRDLRCGCARAASRVVVSPALVLRNLVCAGFAILALAPGAIVQAGFAGLGLSLSVLIFMVAVYLCSEQLIANAQQMMGER